MSLKSPYFFKNVRVFQKKSRMIKKYLCFFKKYYQNFNKCPLLKINTFRVLKPPKNTHKKTINQNKGRNRLLVSFYKSAAHSLANQR